VRFSKNGFSARCGEPRTSESILSTTVSRAKRIKEYNHQKLSRLVAQYDVVRQGKVPGRLSATKSAQSAER